MADEDLLREASDPATSPERLRRMAFRLATKEDFALLSGERGARAADLALRNPSLPFGVFPHVLRQVKAAPIAWFNPAIPLAMLAHPDWAWEEWAHEALLRFGGAHDAGPAGGVGQPETRGPHPAEFSPAQPASSLAPHLGSSE